MRGVFDSAGSRRTCVSARRLVAFRLGRHRRLPAFPFSELITQPAYAPCPTLRVRPRGCPRMARGQDGSLRLSCMTLSFTAPRRFIPTLSSPEGVGHRHLPDRGSNLGLASGRPRRFPLEIQSPEELEALAVPGHHRLRSYDDQGSAPVPPILERHNQNNRSAFRSRGRGQRRLNTVSCWRRAKFSRAISRRLPAKTARRTSGQSTINMGFRVRVVRTVPGRGGSTGPRFPLLKSYSFHRFVKLHPSLCRYFGAGSGASWCRSVVLNCASPRIGRDFGFA